MRVGDGLVHGPCHRSRANDTGAPATSKMRNSPKELTAAPYEVSPHVVKPSRPPLDPGACGVGRGILRYQWGEYLHVGQERGLSRPRPCPIEPLEHEWPSWQAGTGRKKQKKGQNHGDFDCNRAKGVTRDRISLLRSEGRVRIVLGPRTLISEAKATTQNIGVADTMMKDADRRSMVGIRRGRRFALRRIEIEIRLHAARKDV